MPEVTATWTSGAQLVASGTGGHSIVVDAPQGRATWNGFKPAELLLVALLGCTAVDFVGILAKQRQAVRGMSVRATGEQDEKPPWAYRRIELVFTLTGSHLDRDAAQRALDLAGEKYCSVGATIRGVAQIVHRVEIVEEPAAPPA